MARAREADGASSLPERGCAASDVRAAVRHYSRLHVHATRCRRKARMAASEVRRARARLLDVAKRHAALERAWERRCDHRQALREHAEAVEQDELARAAQERTRHRADAGADCSDTATT